VDFKLNFLGVTVSDFDDSFRFYTEALGIIALDTKHDWALFETTGMTLELFGGGRHKGGVSQTIIPRLHVAEEGLIERLSQKGVQFEDEIRAAQGTMGAQFLAPEGLAWQVIVSTSSGPITPLTAIPAPPEGKPQIDLVTLMTGYEQLAVLDSFYQDIMGLSLVNERMDWRRLKQEPDGPELLLVSDPAGRKKRSPISNRREAPHYLSFETQDIKRAANWLRRDDVPVIQDVTRHEWGGIDFQVLDPDNNPVQVVQYR